MATNKPTQSVQVGGYSRRLRIMSRIYFPFRFLSRFSLSEDIFLSTLALSTPASFFASSSNARHPLGFFAAMLIAPCLGNAHEPSVVDASQFAVCESLPDRSGHRGLESVGVVPLRHQCSP